jgi:hypothetical protein
MTYQEPPAARHARLRRNLDRAVEHSAYVNELAVKSSVEVGKEKIQYVEKVSLGCGGTVAIIVSFVGSHAGKLQPRWLLRSALVTLISAMLLGFFRNWIFHWYTSAVWAYRDFDAMLKEEEARRDFVPMGKAASAESGQPINSDTWSPVFEKRKGILQPKLDELKKMERRALRWSTRTEYMTLGLASVGMALLVALAWINF